MRSAPITACTCLLLTALPAAAQSQPLAGEWVSYRDAYRAMVLFDKYGGAKNLLQNHLQVVPRQDGANQPAARCEWTRHLAAAQGRL